MAAAGHHRYGQVVGRQGALGERIGGVLDMGVVWYRFRADARRSWKAWLAVAVLIGLGSGIVLALLAGARRTDSAIDRFVAWSRPADVWVVRGVPGIFDFAELDLAEVARLPEVTDSVPVLILAASGTSPDGVLVTSETVNFQVDPTGRTGTDIDRYKVLAGRVADPSDPDEVMVSFRTAERFDLDVGDSIPTNFMDPSEQRSLFDPTAPEPATFAQLAARGPHAPLRVVGVYVTAGDLAPPETSAGETSGLVVTPAAFVAYRDSLVVETSQVRLHGGAEALPRFLERVEALGGGLPVLAEPVEQLVVPATATVKPVGRALLIAGVLFGVVVMLMGGQALARQAASESGEYPTLSAMGFTRGGLTGLGMMKAVAVALASAATACTFALALSPLFPVGLAQIAEPDPGLRLDGPVLAWGAPLVLVAVAGLGAAAGWWGMHRALDRAPVPTPARVERAVGALARAGARPALVVGVQAALRSGQGRAVSSTVSAIALGVLTTTGAIAFTSSLGHLSSSPPLYGWNWDVQFGSDFAVAFGPEAAAELGRDPAVAALAVGDEVAVDLDGDRVRMLGVEQVVGSIVPSLIRGRAAVDVDEVVVVPGVADVGDTVTVGFGGTATELRVVGVAAIPSQQAMTTLETLRRLAPDTATQFALVRVAAPEEIAPLLERGTEILGLQAGDHTLPRLNAEVANFGRVERLPAVLAALMGLVAVGTLLHALGLSVRRRHRELAVLKALGFVPRQVLATVSWHATTLIGLSLVAGVPLGLALGRGAWLRIADGLGVVPVAVVPVLATASVILASLLVANLAALGPGLRAARAPAAQALRTE